MARRIAALILLQPKLDANYAAVIAQVYPFPRSGVPAQSSLGDQCLA